MLRRFLTRLAYPRDLGGRFGLLLLAFAAVSMGGDHPVMAQGKGTDQQGDPLPEGARVRLGTLRWRHPQDVTLVAYASDGMRVITSTQDGVVRVWDRGTGKEIRSIDPSSVQNKNAGRPAIRYYRGLSRAAVSMDGNVIATMSAANAIQLWDSKTGKEIRQLKAPIGFITALAFAPDGKSLAARSSSRMTYLIETATGNVLHQIKAPLQKGPIRINAGGQGNYSAIGLAFSPDGKTLAAADLDYANQKINTYVRFTNTQTGKEIRHINTAPNGVFGIAYSPDGKTLAYATTQGVHLVAADTLKEIHKLAAPQTIAGIAFSPDSATVAIKSRDNVIRLFDAKTGKKTHDLGDPPAAQGGNFAVVAVSFYGADTGDFAFSADGKVLTAGSGQTLRFWNVATGKEQSLAGGHRGAALATIITPDGKTIYSRGADGSIRRWDADSGAELGKISEPRGTGAAAFSPDGKTVALANADNTIRFHSLPDGKEIHKLKGHVNGIGAMAFTRDGKAFATRGNYDGLIRVYDVARGNIVREIALAGANAGGNGAIVFRPIYGAGQGQTLAFSPDGQTIAASVTANNVVMIQDQPRQAAGSSLHLWDISTGKEIRQLTLPAGRAAVNLAYSPDGRFLAAENADQSVCLWEIASGRERAVLGKPGALVQPPQPNMGFIGGGGFGGVNRAIQALATLAFSTDGGLLASRGPDNTVRVWDVSAGKVIGQFKGHVGAIHSVVFSADDKSIATGSADTTVLVWDVTRLKRTPKLAAIDLQPKQLDTLWADLIGDDAIKAGASIRTLAAGKQTPGYLAEKLSPSTPPDARKIKMWIADLDTGNFKLRAIATQELEKLGELAAPALKQVLTTNPTVETRRRVEPLLEKLATGTLTREQLRMVRALEALETNGTPEARKLVAALAHGAAGTLQTRRAQEALDSLTKRAASAR